MEVKDVAIFIKEVGFPIFIAVYVLIRMEKAMKSLTASINNMSSIVSALTGKHLDKLKED